MVIADVSEDDSFTFAMVAGVQLQLDLRHGEGFFTTSTTVLLLYRHKMDVGYIHGMGR